MAQSGTGDRAVAAAIEARLEPIAEGWTARHLAHPAVRRGAAAELPAADLAAAYTRSWTLPVLRVLIGALRGEPEWLAVYRDERRRYLRALPAAELEQTLAPLLAADLAELQALVSGTAGAGRADGGGSGSGALGATPLLQRAHRGRDLTGTRVRLELVGDCLMTEVRAFLDEACEPLAVTPDVRHEYFSASQGIAPTAASTTAAVGAGQTDLVALSPTTFEAFPAYLALLADAGRLRGAARTDRVTALVAAIRAMLEDLRQAGDTTLLLHLPCGLPLHGVRRRVPVLPPLGRGQRRALAELRAALAELAAATPNVIALDEQALLAGAGLRGGGAPLFPDDVVGDAAFHTSRFGPLVAARYAEIAAAYASVGRCKVLCVDLDDTLWAGVMAEGPVHHHGDRQALLAELRAAGILLVAVSKNDPAALRWEEIGLDPDDFVLHKVGWGLKASSIAEAAAQLNLGLDAFVFVDDNPVERALVAGELPTVSVLDANEPHTWQALRWLLEFPATGTTAEARSRTEKYRAAAERREAMVEGLDYPSMMRSLQLRVRSYPVEETVLPRVVELLGRTNQMNTTTRRRTAEDLRALAADPTAEVCCYELADRFGDLGLVGVTVSRRNPALVIDSLVMSCRAMGFGLEQLMVATALAGADPDEPVLAEFVPTDRNGPAASVFAGSGFAAVDGGWRLPRAGDAVPAPEWLQR